MGDWQNNVDNLMFQPQVDSWAGIAGRCKLVWGLGVVTHLQRHLHSWIWSCAQQTRMEAYQQQYHVMIHQLALLFSTVLGVYARIHKISETTIQLAKSN